MAKNKNMDFTPMSDLLEEKKKLEKKMSKIMIPCSHTGKNGKVKFDFIKGNLVRCKRCGCKFDFSVIDTEELDSAVRTIHNAINQIKAMTEDPDAESRVIQSLGEMDYNLKQMSELYNKAINKYNKGGKKNNNKNRSADFGAYGASSIDFIGGKKKKW